MSVQGSNVNAGQLKTIPYRFYTDSGVLQEEQEKIFSQSWQYVAHESQVAYPGDFITCEVAGEPIIVIRGDDGKLRAFYNVCPHRGTQIEKKEAGSKKILQCSYHGWTFKLNGNLNKAPNFKGVEGFCANDFCLHAVRVETEATLVFVNLDPGAPSLASAYHDFFDDFKRFTFLDQLKKSHVRTRTIKSNWKAFIDNFLECDHCPIAHPGFAATLDLSKYHIVNGESCNIQGSSIKDKKGSGTIDLDLKSAEVQEGRFYWLWPNFMVTVYPGPGNISTIQMVPVDHETTLGIYTFYLIGDEPTKEQKILMDFAEQVRIEDVELVEMEQVGFKSRAFEHGIVSPTEHGVYHFHQMLRQALNI
ncbi:phenylpropionate dioxygenase-like ring-hydroxylating dioxygenase large terminal subunit [Scopulibacillus darangshiensis]|uniref:Phenylpropionate dioxygenase-like ring-hydroxylating dioxygenase large terminal subunit n=1 Tax=Scopulibacillus darangshiensis TaxID=442528 RepID=A0A4V2SKZ3_9BACL|nr:aromatic ring-hydroxylating dioxygenase subunit alpha [Scopulibacillus darangshiensis]TCP21276.1 phenylpropionate dioxygenase-like ring-hydroxylating dioxygenase large terminal subunit [Scopulibacillus darangshiensis]